MMVKQRHVFTDITYVTRSTVAIVLILQITSEMSEQREKVRSLEQLTSTLPICFFTHRRRNTSLVPTTYRMDQRATTFNGLMWHKSACPIATRLCAMNSVSL